MDALSASNILVVQRGGVNGGWPNPDHVKMVREGEDRTGAGRTGAGSLR
jgi:hypothetical protein